MQRKHLCNATSSLTHTEKKWRLTASFCTDIRNVRYQWSDESNHKAKWIRLVVFPFIWYLWQYPRKMLHLQTDKEFHNLIPGRLIILILHWFSQYHRNIFRGESSVVLQCTSLALKWKCWLIPEGFGCVDAGFHLHFIYTITMTIKTRYRTQTNPALFWWWMKAGKNVKWAGSNRY